MFQWLKKEFEIEMNETAFQRKKASINFPLSQWKHFGASYEFSLSTDSIPFNSMKLTEWKNPLPDCMALQMNENLYDCTESVLIQILPNFPTQSFNRLPVDGNELPFRTDFLQITRTISLKKFHSLVRLNEEHEIRLSAVPSSTHWSDWRLSFKTLKQRDFWIELLRKWRRALRTITETKR